MGKNGSTVVLFRDGSRREVFLVFRSDYPVWVTTGGGAEHGENPKETALREAFEETGFKVKIVRYVGLYQRKSGGVEYKSYLFEGRVLSGEFKPEFPGCKGRWFPVGRLPLSMTDRTREKILDCINYQSGQFEKEHQPLMLRNNLRLLLLHPIAAVVYIVRNLWQNTNSQQTQ